MNFKPKSWRAIGAACVALTFAIPAATFGAGCKSSQRLNLFQMSREQEIDLGKKVAAETESKNKIVTSGPQYERLQRVAAKILPLAKRDYDVPYKVKLIQSDEVNAFAAPGGPIYFYTGLMDIATTDDEVASVLGHEASHVVKRHVAKQISDANSKGLIAELLLGKSSQVVQTVAGIALQLDQLRYSRGDESQADEVGFKYLTQAGYDPESMADFFRKMEKKTGNGGTEFLQSHPLTSKRIEQAEERAKKYRQKQALAGESVNNQG